MDDPRILRIITVGLVLAALAVVYFLFTGGFSVGKSKVSQTQINKVVQSPTPSSVLGQDTQVLSTPAPTPTPSPMSAYNRIASRNQGNVQTLPRTGFPDGLAVVFSLSAVVTGFALSKFPK